MVCHEDSRTGSIPAGMNNPAAPLLLLLLLSHGDRDTLTSRKRSTAAGPACPITSRQRDGHAPGRTGSPAVTVALRIG